MKYRKKRKMSKAKSETWHFKRRIRERYGIFCNRYLYHKMVDIVKNGDSEFVKKDTNRCAIHLLRLHQSELKNKCKVPADKDGIIKIYVVYDKIRGELVTALPWRESTNDVLSEYDENRRKHV